MTFERKSRRNPFPVNSILLIQLAFLLWVIGVSCIKAEEKGKLNTTKPTSRDSIEKAAAPKDTAAQNLRDPFLPWGEVPGKGPPPPPLQLKLKGILWSAKKPLAIVEDAARISYIVTENQDIGDNRTILRIKKDRIVIKERSGKTLEIKLLDEATTSPPSPGS